jgi:hypothetical protein
MTAMWVRLTDASLFAHAAGLIILGFMTLWAARTVHDRGYWKSWPPELLVIWGVSELADGAVYLRRWLSQETEWGFVRYEGWFSFLLNTVSMVAILMLIWRIRQGDIEEEGDSAPPEWPPKGAPRV